VSSLIHVDRFVRLHVFCIGGRGKFDLVEFEQQFDFDLGCEAFPWTEKETLRRFLR
jgi:hypothetical protein